MCLTLLNICFSPVERPFSWSRRARLRTTSAISSTSPVLILSWLCLTRRFQFMGILVGSSRSTPSTSSTMGSEMTGRMPALSDAVHRHHDGHVVVEDLDAVVAARRPLEILLHDLQDAAGAVMRIDDRVTYAEHHPYRSSTLSSRRRPSLP